jgi:hypothetical protein
MDLEGTAVIRALRKTPNMSISLKTSSSGNVVSLSRISHALRETELKQMVRKSLRTVSRYGFSSKRMKDNVPAFSCDTGEIHPRGRRGGRPQDDRRISGLRIRKRQEQGDSGKAHRRSEDQEMGQGGGVQLLVAWRQ